LNRKFTVGFAVFLGVGLTIILRSYMLDFIGGDYLVTSGTVESITQSVVLAEKTIHVNKEAYSLWFNYLEVETRKSYEIYYTPRTKTIVRLLEAQ
jgi:hypothetical protein